MPESIEQHCVSIFREVVGIAHPVQISDWDDARLLQAPFESIEVDSLTLLDFVMQVESAYDIELDEAAVNACSTIRELATLVVAARQ
jgi:acyl carrier protein